MPHHLAPGVRVHRERVDQVGPPVAVGVAVAQQLLGDLVPVVADQDGAKVVPRRGRELQQQSRRPSSDTGGPLPEGTALDLVRQALLAPFHRARHEESPARMTQPRTR